MRSRKAFAYEYVKGKTKVRVLMPPSAKKFKQDEHFQWFEESDYLNEALNGVPYATYKTDDLELMEGFLQNGYTDPKTGIVWRSFFGFWKDQEGRAYMSPETYNITLESVGVSTFMKSRGDFMKVGKYVNRLFSALTKSDPTINPKSGKVEVKGVAVWGKEIGWNETFQTAVILIDQEPGENIPETDRMLSIRYVDLDTLTAEEKALVDGAILVNGRAVTRLGLSTAPELGTAWRGTFGTERALGKGHMLYKHNMEVDVVIYGPKTIVRTNRFFFGCIAELHVGVPHTDRQAFVNFHFYRPGLAVERAKNFMLEVMEASGDESAFRRLVLTHTVDPRKTGSDMEENPWVLGRSLQFGVSYLRYPGLYRRAYTHLMTKAMQCDENARIPLDTVAKYAYVLPAPSAIDKDGSVVIEGGIPEGTIVFPDLEPGTKVVCYRQPSENTNAWVGLTVIHRPEYDSYIGRGICLLGRGADKTLGRLGGGDMDDQFVIIYDPTWVEAFYTMRPYPETEKVTAEVTTEEMGENPFRQSTLDQETEVFEDEMGRAGYVVYANRHVSQQINMAKRSRAGIGPVVNYGIFDMLLSDPDQVSSMMDDLLSRGTEQADEAAEWLKKYASWTYPGKDKLPGTTPYGYHARKYMSNLETVIDGNVKDTTLLAKLGNVNGAITAFHKNAMVYPQSMVRRIPRKKFMKGDWVGAMSLTCKALAEITRTRDEMMEEFRVREWSLLTPADDSLRKGSPKPYSRAFPWEREIVTRVAGQFRKVEGVGWEPIHTTPSILDIWKAGWKAWRETPENERDLQDVAYAKICELLEYELFDADDDMRMRLAVELYYQTYRSYNTEPRRDEVTGNIRGYQDALLWSPVFANYFINALREARLAGYYHAVELRPEFRNRLMNKVVEVQVRNNSVFIQDDKDEYTVWVGFVAGRVPPSANYLDGMPLPDSRAGETYLMDNGVLEYRAPESICLPDKGQGKIIPQKPVRIYPSDPSQPTEESKRHPVGVFAKLLKEARIILGFDKK